MKAIIFHGTDCKPGDFWYQWLKDELEKRGVSVSLPYYPNINREPIDEFLPKVLKDNELDENTVLIGHSSGSSLILSILQHIEHRISQAVLVAGFCEPIPGSGDPILQKTYDWERIKEKAGDFVFINSDNDPWGCDDKQGRTMFDNLGGTQIIRHDGHFGSSKDPEYKQFPLLLRLIKRDES